MSKINKKNKLSNIDEVYSNGLFEFVRSGKIVTISNIASAEDNAQIFEFFKEGYLKTKESIDYKIQKIINEISLCDPLMLLKFTQDIVNYTRLNKFSEINYSFDENVLVWAQEYIQSILVSTENHFENTESIEEQENHWSLIHSNIENLYSEVLKFYNYWYAYKKDSGEITDDLLHYIVESQIFYLVRGNRYQIFEIEPIKKLLTPQNDVLVELFGITSIQLVEGLSKLQYSLSQGKVDAWMNLSIIFDDFRKKNTMNSDFILENQESIDLKSSIVEKAFGTSLNNVSQVTGWDDRLLDALSLNVGECTSFLNDQEFSGWPIVEMPTKKKPFIKIDGIVYGFDYYSIFDNFYRALQKEIFHLKPDYIEKWNIIQNLASEEMVKDIFSNLLPGATVYIENYYPKESTIKQMAENDILIIYENYLFIIEVKAGSFPQTPPINDFNSHINAYTKLAQDAESQCNRTVKYINSHNPAIFYNSDKKIKFEITNHSKIREIFTFSVTIDNFNEFAAKAEKLNFITLESKTIVISYDDLLTYEKYFDSSIHFIHFLKQRKLAIDITQIALNDELDHLGMYIKHNMYSITASEFPIDYKIDWHGYRENLDEYFCSLYHPTLNPIKPVQNLPILITEIIKKLQIKINQNSIDIAHFILDMSSEAKDDFINTINTIIKRQREIKRMLVTSAFGDLKYCLFVSIPGLKVIENSERLDYVLSATFCDVTKPILWINIDFDSKDVLIDVHGQICRNCDIPNSDIERLCKLSVEYKKSRIKSFRDQYHRKIGRNDPCPCGSGKKYKKCCINIDRVN